MQTQRCTPLSSYESLGPPYSIGLDICAALAAIASVAIQPISVAAQTPPVVDVVFLIDGSGSIDSSDWEIQKQGIAGTLANNDLFPADGTVAISVIQWSSSISVELDRWILSSPAKRTEAANQIRAMDQIGGGTSPHLGINAALGQFSGGIDEANSHVLCLSTDGLPTSQSSLEQSANNAEAFGFDRLAVVGIEDPPFFNANDANNAYGPAVFGGGTVSIARGSVEFANLIGASCLNQAAELIALEVNQAVQSWDTSVDLIEGKQTVVRAFVQTADGSTTSTPAQLFGTRNGQPLPQSPLPAAAGGGKVEISGDVATKRDDIDATINFTLPPSWSSGSVELRLELPGGLVCKEAAPPENTCTAEIDHVETEDLKLRVLAVEYDDDAGTTQIPKRTQLEEQALRTETLFPVANVSFEAGAMLETFSSKPKASTLLTKLREQRELECKGSCDEEQYWYGLALGIKGGGLAGRPGTVGVGYAGSAPNKSGTGSARNRGPHEVAHNLGRTHVVKAEEHRFGFLWLQKEQRGWCGEDAPAESPAWPDVGQVDGAEMPVLGPVGDADTEIWGLDHRFIKSNKHLAISNPLKVSPMLSYCNTGEGFESSGQARWIGKFTYEALMAARTGSGGDSSDLGDTAWDTAPWDGVLVSGLVDLENSSVEFSDTRAIPNVGTSNATAGPLSLDVYDGNGALAQTLAVDPEVLVGDGQENHEGTFAWFGVSIRVPDAGIGRLALNYDEEELELGELVGSDNAPTVSFTSPTAGQVVDGDSVTVSWEGSDADGDDLTYGLYYSPDGLTWTGLAASTTDTSVEVPRNLLAASSSGRLVVIASDGVNSTHVESPHFVVDNNAPVVTITSPEPGELYSGVQVVQVETISYDREDSDDDLQYSWSSNVDGAQVGDSEVLVVNASALTVGTHIITVQVTDTNGASSTDSVEIHIERLTVTDPEDDQIYFSGSHAGTIGGVRYYDEDILVYDSETGTHSMFFDGSDVGLTRDVDGFTLLDDGSLLLSFDQPFRHSGIGIIDDSDIVRFVPTSTGDDTAGTVELFLDGSDVGLTTASEDIDAIAVTPDGRLVISTWWQMGHRSLRAGGQDMIVLDDATFGANSAGTWSLYFDGSDVALQRSSERIRGISIDPATNLIALTTQGRAVVPGVRASGDDVIQCEAMSLEPGTTECSYALIRQEMVARYMDALHTGPPTSLGG